MKIYTRTGDKGQTSLFGGARVSKAHPRVMAYGALDELNSYLGVCASIIRKSQKYNEEFQWILQVQKDIFALGSWLASPEASARVEKGEEAFPGARQARTHIGPERIAKIESDIDQWEKVLEPMKSFLLPGGSEMGAQIHFARTLCRRSERECILLREQGEIVPDLAVQYLNRINDALFVLARYLNHKENCQEDPWN